MAGPRELPPDEVLVQRLRDGDEETFALVLDSWSGGMLRLATSFVSTRASAEEAVQDTWLAVIRGIGGFEGRASLKTWVYRILVNTAKARGTKESRTVPFASLLPEEEGPTVDAERFRAPGEPYAGHWIPGQKPRPWHLPEDHVLRGEVREVISAAIDELPPRLRTVITLRDVAGYGSDEVCSLLEISPGNQRVLLHRGRALLRRKLESYLFDAQGVAGGRERG
ncbi:MULTISPECIES: RNA polymerase sigma factor [Streptomyces]|uniref:RNA polymerase sigma factor n=1 Tax=Streptomyces TaxID=1883 RepID=UPI000F77746E|nr:MULTISPECIES: sigma-70 family RNA polymerase sigma factor [Streptomyces]RST08924.1 sigma-70 family RNA polymerase sigma factor [Streptomyces sp. WAC07149]GLX19583.1 RNA polymerase sigma24 factor [Streptomyces lavendulae subsp. lavendulae]GLX27078.1 RNA polymerase sigma24 factor [Streptomyces lavendulae subsp. lavendulae]